MAGMPPPEASARRPARYSLLVFLSADDERFSNRRLTNGVYSVQFGRRTPDLTTRVADFIRYETSMGRTTLLCTEYPFDVESHVKHALASTPAPERPRPRDPRIVVHSTTADRLRSIMDCGAILPAAAVRQRLPEMALVGFEEFGEPEDYTRFVYFAPYGSPVGEVVVHSHQEGRVVTDFDALYTPGGRIYLDFLAMLHDGVLRRDGIHVAKAHGAVALPSFCVDIITAPDIPESSQRWTPGTFSRAADALFASRHPEYFGLRSEQGKHSPH